MKKFVKYILVIALLGLLGYNSVYFKKLSDVKKAGNEKFDAAAFAKKLWNEKMTAKIDSAVQLSALLAAVSADKEAALNTYSNAIDIGNYRYAIIQTQGTVISLNDEEVQMSLILPDSNMNAVLATEYIYGNAVRDASALVDVKDFPNSTDLSSISEGLNNVIRKELLPSFKKTVKKGDKINIVAAVEINKEHIKWTGLELIPLRLQIVP